MLNVNTNKMMSKKLTFGVIVSSRNFFNAESAVTARSAIEKKLSDLGYIIVIADRKATDFGAVFISTIQNGLIILNVTSFWQQVIMGIVVLIAVIFDKYRKLIVK